MFVIPSHKILGCKSKLKLSTSSFAYLTCISPHLQPFKCFLMSFLVRLLANLACIIMVCWFISQLTKPSSYNKPLNSSNLLLFIHLLNRDLGWHVRCPFRAEVYRGKKYKFSTVMSLQWNQSFTYLLWGLRCVLIWCLTFFKKYSISVMQT